MPLDGSVGVFLELLLPCTPAMLHTLPTWSKQPSLPIRTVKTKKKKKREKIFKSWLHGRKSLDELFRMATEAEYSSPLIITWNVANGNKHKSKPKRILHYCIFHQIQPCWTKEKLRTEAIRCKLNAGPRQQQLHSLHFKPLEEPVHAIAGGLINLSHWCLYNLIR